MATLLYHDETFLHVRFIVNLFITKRKFKEGGIKRMNVVSQMIIEYFIKDSVLFNRVLKPISTITGIRRSWI